MNNLIEIGEGRWRGEKREEKTLKKRLAMKAIIGNLGAFHRIIFELR